MTCSASRSEDFQLRPRPSSEACGLASYAWSLLDLGDVEGARAAAMDAAFAWTQDDEGLTEVELEEVLDATHGEGRSLLGVIRVASAIGPWSRG